MLNEQGKATNHMKMTTQQKENKEKKCLHFSAPRCCQRQCRSPSTTKNKSKLNLDRS